MTIQLYRTTGACYFPGQTGSAPPPKKTPNHADHFYVYGRGRIPQEWPSGKVNPLLDAGKLFFAKKVGAEGVFLVEKNAINRYAREIYEFDTLIAVQNIRVQHPDSDTQFQLFSKVEKNILEQLSPGRMRHISFMLKQSSEAGADYVAATAVLLHHLSPAEAKSTLNHILGKKNNGFKSEVLEALGNFQKVNSICYQPREGQPENEIQTYMRAMIKLAEGNWRGMLLFWVHKLSSIRMLSEEKTQTEDAKDIAYHTICEIIAPLAEWFGQKSIASRLRNEAFRLHARDEFERHEYEIVQALGMSRSQAEDYLKKFDARLKIETGDNLSFTTHRVKSAWDAHAKTEYKPDEYPDINSMKDLLGEFVITKRKSEMKTAVNISVNAASTDCDFVIADQMKPEKYEVGDKTVYVHHVGIQLKGNRSIELQFMDEETYRIIESGHRAHWAYKLEQITKAKKRPQSFDRTFLETCSKKMNGDLAHDLEVVYSELKDRVYVFLETLPGKRNGGQRQTLIKELPAGVLPLDLVASILNPDQIFDYNGIKMNKNKGGEGTPLADGDHCQLIANQNPQYFKNLAEREQGLRVVSRRAYLFLKLYSHNLFKEAVKQGEKELQKETGLGRLSKERIAILNNRMGFLSLAEFYAYYYLRRDDKDFRSAVKEYLLSDNLITAKIIRLTTINQ